MVFVRIHPISDAFWKMTNGEKKVGILKKISNKIGEIELKIISVKPLMFVLLILVSLLSGAFVGKF
jgi:hypothetical protein